MAKVNREKLLENPEIIDEINRHLWIESEKAGYDIGFDKAAQDWLDNYAEEWLNYHSPAAKAPKKKPSAETKPKASGKRSAKTYI